MLYKICTDEEWRAAEQKGVYQGSAVDHRDGFIHLSTRDQVEETARRHFAGQSNLVLVALDEHALTNIRWEPSRGGALFPHVYGVVPVTAAVHVQPLPEGLMALANR